MENVELGELVKMAKGDDRSLREYAKDADIDPAIISRIINGNYIPKKPDIFLKLTSPKAAPRGGVNYEQLIKAADATKSYQEGIAIGLAATETLLTAIGGLPLAVLSGGIAALASAGTAKKRSKKKESSDREDISLDELTLNKDKMLAFDKKQKDFRKAARAIIITALAAKGISCKIEDVTTLDYKRGRPDEYLSLTDQAVSEWWLSFWYKDTDLDERIIVFPEDRAQLLMSRYIFAPADPMRKASIVVDDPVLFNKMLNYKGQTSYRGEMSIVLVDTSKFQVVKEEYVAHFDEADTEREFHIV